MTHAVPLRVRKTDYGTGQHVFCFAPFPRVTQSTFQYESPFGERRIVMPQSKFQRAMFALLTVLVTVHAYVFYSLYVVNGSTFISYAQFIDPSIQQVIPAINALGGVEMFGTRLPIWAIVVIEFVCAYSLEMLVGSPCSFKLACKNFDMKTTHPVLFETAIICATVGIMCPAMSFLAAFMYYPYAEMSFNIFTLLANWLKLVCFNLPFAFFTQLFFIQPLVRKVFKLIFARKAQA